MTETSYDIILIGSGSGGLSVGLFMAKAGFKVLMVSKSDDDIGGDCHNDGCVPNKALIHVSHIAHNARMASNFGLDVLGKVDIKKSNRIYLSASGNYSQTRKCRVVKTTRNRCNSRQCKFFG